MKIEKLQNPKIEKAEILEYTVQFLQSTMKPSEMPQDNFSQEYQFGFQHCLQTTLHLINSSQKLSYVSKNFLLQQLLLNHPDVSSSMDHQYLTLHGQSPSCSHMTSTQLDCITKSQGNQENKLISTQTGLSSDQKSCSWRPWV
ncbi:unnamed protein product [Staurois parvus]|uniref:Orange domain-containing protein n=1 Tax=Staurois parvus TaxID=386267 RepID=A0ABN9FA40_9NEOB|nr:unnamed protein product [Staurois parvus]